MKIETIWSEYRFAIKAFLYSKVADRDDADDLLQEILIKTYNNLHTVKTAASVRSWLFQIANRTIIDFYRKRSKEVDLKADDLWYSENDDKTHQALSACITPFISALPKESAELLTAIDIQGYPQKSYAEHFGISYSTLKSRVQKDRAQLRRLFEDCCHLTLDQRGNITDFDPKPDSCKNC